jgi:hypothetical protein
LRLAGAAWITEGYEGFRKGDFDSSGANLYVSRKGIVQTIHRLDVNNDGYPDLIFNNTHDLAYVPPAYEYEFRARTRANPVKSEFPGVGAVRVLTADLNGDGLPELVIARGFDDTTRVQNSWIYWGNRDGWTERFHTELPTPYVEDACVGDLNHDGRPDLIFIASSAVGVNRSYVYWGGPDGFSYRNRTEFETPRATGCAVADLDHDRFADLVVAAGGNNGRIYWGGAAGPDFRKPTPLPVADTVAAVAGDGRLFVSTKTGVSVLAFAKRALSVDQELPLHPAGRLAVADLNKDGAADLLVTLGAAGRIYWGQDTAGHARFDATHFTELPALGAADVAIGDIDQDGFPDIVFANSRSARSFDIDSYIYWGGKDGYQPTRRTELPTHGAQGVAVSGSRIFFANSMQGRPIGDIDTYVYFGNASGKYSPENMQRLPTVGGYESCLADLNDDGYTDVVLLGSHEGDPGGAAGSHIYWGSKDGLSPSRRSELPTHGAIGCAIADLNHDGYLDLLFANMDPGSVQIFFGGANGFDSKRQVSWPVADPRFPAIADLNRDGYLDLLIPSVSDGLLIYWGSNSGYDPHKFTHLDGVGTVSEQVADLDGDGYLDIIVCNLLDDKRGIYQGINSQIYWGSAQGYSPARRSELPSHGAHHAVVADFNRDGYLDIFVSNYQSEFTRSQDSYLYWGNAQATYTPEQRLSLHNESAAGVIAADLNGDGWIDLAVSNHVQNGDHHTRSLIFWNGPDGFSAVRTEALPTVGPHMMTGVDQGNIYTRALDETYVSAPYDAGGPKQATLVAWQGTADFGSRLSFDLRSAESAEALKHTPWAALQTQGSQGHELQVPPTPVRRWWQYRVHFQGGQAAWPTLRNVQVEFSEH